MTMDTSRLAAAATLQSEGKKEEALDIYLSILTDAPDHPEALKGAGLLSYATGALPAAIELLNRALAAVPDSAQLHAVLGAIHYTREEWRASCDNFEAVTRLTPNDARAFANFGNAALEAGELNKAITAFEEASRIDPESTEFLGNLAGAYQNAGRVDDAVSIFGRAFESDPTNARFAVALGAINNSLGNFEAAVGYFEQASALGVAIADVSNDHGVALQNLGRHNDAVGIFENALADAPGHAATHSNLSVSLVALERGEEGLEHALEAVRLAPGEAMYLRNVGSLFVRQGKFDQALEWFERAVAEAPENIDGQLILVATLIDLDRRDEAFELTRSLAGKFPESPEVFDELAGICRMLGKGIAAFNAAETALNLTPDSVVRKRALAEVLADSLQYDDAIDILADGADEESQVLRRNIQGARKNFNDVAENFLRALADAPETTFESGDVVETILKLCDWERSENFVTRLVERIEGNLAAGRPLGVAVNNLQALPVSYGFIASAAHNASLDLVENLERPVQPNTVATNRKRIRIGYVVPYVHFHSLPMLLKQIIEHHDRNRFEVFGYCPNHPEPSDFSRSYRAAFDKFSECGRDPAAAARQIAQDDIDILIDVSGQTLDNCLSIMARRPARLTVHYLGYSITTGADFIDYLVTDEIYLPPSDMELGPETAIYMPDTFMPAVAVEVADTEISRQDCGLPEDGTVFCNFNQLFKLEPEIFSVWMRILSALEDSVLWLGGWSAASVHNLRRSARRHGVDPERLVFGDIVRHPEHLARLCQVDLALDTYHHGGGVTTIDCLSAGIPVLTASGKTPSSRLGHSILKAAGLGEFVVADLEAYENRAVELGRDRAGLKSMLKNWNLGRSNTALFDMEKYVRHLERGYELIWQNLRAGNGPKEVRIAKNPNG